MEKIKILELFSGYGSQKLALDYLGIPCESTQCEIDKYAVDAYNQIHGETENLGDICKVDETKLPYYDLITYSSPCQDFSVAGLQKGGDKDSGTRSSLLWECERIIKAVKPKYLLMENVKNLVGKQHKHNFIAWLDTLDALGYNNYWQVLNAKDYGVPQNRERVFVVSIRKDIQQGYTFPEKIPLEKRLKDILEDSVDEKYYLSDRMVNFFIKNSEDNAKKGNGFRFTPQFGETYARAVTTNAGSRMDDNFIKEPICASSRGRNPENPSDRTAGIYLEQTLEFNKDGCTNTLTTVQKDNYIVEPKIIQRGHGFNKGGEFEEAPTITANGKYQENNFIVEPLAYDEQNGYIRQDGCVGTLTTDGSSPKHNNRIIEPNVIQLGNIVETGNWDNPQRGRIYSAEGCSPALNTMQGGGLEPKIVTYNIPQTVSVRKYDVDEQKLVGILREHKQKSGLTNNQISEKLDLPLTMVEHWFRQDNSFAIPNADIWQELKTLLGIKTDEFDLSITEFEEKEGVFEKANRCYGDDGLAPTLTSTSSDEKVITNYRIRKLTPRECWRLMGVKDEQYDKLHDISNTQLYKMAGNSIVADVLVAIFRNLFINKTEYVKKGNLFNL